MKKLINIAYTVATIFCLTRLIEIEESYLAKIIEIIILLIRLIKTAQSLIAIKLTNLNKNLDSSNLSIDCNDDDSDSTDLDSPDIDESSSS